MYVYEGCHDSTVDFPVIGIKSKYPTVTDSDVVIAFPGVAVYQFPQMVMHYLDDEQALGWSWLPPQDFIDLVMKNGTIELHKQSIMFTSPVDPFRVHNHLERKRIGYLKKDTTATNGFKLIDTQGGDFNIKNAVHANIGKAPEAFINKMRELVKAAEQYEHYNGNRFFQMPPKSHQTPSQSKLPSQSVVNDQIWHPLI